MKCEVCGCTDSNACMTPSGPCHWVRPGLCSGCAGVPRFFEAGEFFRESEDRSLILPGDPDFRV